MKKVMKLIGKIIIISLILAVIAILAICGYFYFFKKGEIAYGLSNDGTYYVVSGFSQGGKYGKVTEIDIPETYKGLPVKGIANNSFKDKEMFETISLPDTLEAIGGDAFAGTGYYQDQSNWEIEYGSDGKELYRSLYIGKYLIEVKFNGEALLKDNGKCEVIYNVKEGTLGIAQAAFRTTTKELLIDYEYDYIAVNIQDRLSFVGAGCYSKGGAYEINTLSIWDSTHIASYNCIHPSICYYNRFEINYNGTLQDWVRFEGKEIKEMLDSGKTQSFDGTYNPDSFTKYVVNCTDAHLKKDNSYNDQWIISH